MSLNLWFSCNGDSRLDVVSDGDRLVIGAGEIHGKSEWTELTIEQAESLAFAITKWVNLRKK